MGDPSPPSPRRTPRAAKVLLWIGGAVIVLLPLSWIVFYLVGSSSLKAALASVRAAGFSTALAELAPPPVPSERNAAPLFEAAFALHPDPEEEDPALHRAVEEGFSALRAEEKAAVRDLLRKGGALFAKLRTGRQLGSCRYERDYQRGLLMEMPEAPRMLRTARLLRIRAQSEAEAGRPQEARESVRDMLALAEGYRQEPVLILQLIRLTVVTLAVETIDACVTADTPVADLRAWLEVLPKPESLQGAMDLGFRGELASGAQFAGKPIGDSLLAVDPAQKKSAAEGSAVLAPYWRNTGARYLRSMLRLVETSRKPYLEARPEITAFIQNLQGKRSVFDLLSALLIPAISKGLDCQVKAQASLAVAQAGLTAELERASTGRYPLKIETVDPLSGKSLLYQREEGTISSAGLPESAPGSIGDEKAAWKLRQSAAPDKK